MSCKDTIDYSKYYSHGVTPSDEEAQVLKALAENLPDQITDSHTHMSNPDHFVPEDMSEFSRGHMISTFPVTTLGMSKLISDVMFPGIDVRKLRFAHAFRGIAHASVNSFLSENNYLQDQTALFGLHDSPQGVEYTVDQLRTGKYTGLKMYYSAGAKPVYDLFEYFPEPVLETAQQENIPIILHLPNSLEESIPELIALVDKFPQLRIVLAHAGVTWTDGVNTRAVFDKVAQLPNVMADTSGVAEAAVLEKLIRSFGSKRVLFGSDEPLNLLREQSYVHPDLGPRIITDFPYHWVDLDEQQQYGGTVGPPRYNHIMQLEALLTAIRRVASSGEAEQRMVQDIFHDNNERVFGL